MRQYDDMISIITLLCPGFKRDITHQVLGTTVVKLLWVQVSKKPKNDSLKLKSRSYVLCRSAVTASWVLFSSEGQEEQLEGEVAALGAAEPSPMRELEPVRAPPQPA